MADWTQLPITDGTAQSDRFPAALREGYFNVDEMRYEELLAMSAEFASTLRFYNLQNEPDGDWAELFANDEAVIMAQILATDLKQEEAAFLHLLEKDDAEQARVFILQWASRVNEWYKRLNVSGQRSGTALSWKLAELIKVRLAVDLRNIVGRRELRPITSAGSTSDLSSEFDVIWSLAERGFDSLEHPAGLPPVKDSSERKGALRSGFYAFYNAVSYLKRITPAYFEESLHSQAHGPAIGLFLAFLKLYRKIQDNTNRFTQRHLNFYYYEFLQFKPRPPVADSAYLVFESAPAAKDIPIPKGAVFSAGKGDAQKVLTYGADAAMTVSDAQVGSLCTLYLERDELLSPEKELAYITHVRTHQLALAGQDDADLSAVPLFGAAKKEARRSSALGARVGFAAASPALLLLEGEREIEITLCYADPPDIDEVSGKGLLASLSEANTEERFFSLFGKLMTRYLLLHRDWLSEEHKKYILDKARKRVSEVSLGVIGGLLERGRQDLFYKLFRNAFHVSLTAESGWLTVANYAVIPFSEGDPLKRNGLKVALSLGPEVAPIVPYAAVLHGGDWDTRLPMIQFLVNSQADYYPYSILRDLILKEIVIEARVKGIKNIVAYNNHGQIDPTAPWNPFGPLPGDHSYFIIGSHEAAKKQLTALTVNIEWGELPKSAGGFEAYYKEYGETYNNQSFKVAMAVFRDGIWQPAKSDVNNTASLFDATADGDGLSGEKTLKVDVLHHFKPVNPALAPEAYRYDMKARNGFFRFTFLGPDGAFGHKIYPLLLTKALSVNVNTKLKKLKPIPNPPYTPLINRMTLDYTAKSVIECATGRHEGGDALREKLFHIHPFGMEEISFAGKDKFHYLLPRHLDYGNLFIGIVARRLGGMVTLFFHMAADSTQDAAGDRPAINWYYLTSNRWRPLEKARVISDTTLGFLSSGIVTLDIPEAINRDNTIMPNDRYWLRVCADKNLQSFSGLYTVRAQAVKVSRLAQRDSAQFPENAVPAGSIRQAVVALPGLAKLLQLDGSFGGRPQETPAQLKTRISERLRHKNRACTPWDYERLVLERFPNLYKAKCFANSVSSEMGKPQPGHVMIVVVPHLRITGAAQDFMPMVNSVELYQIREYLQGLAPPFVNIAVRNPLYEHIQVRCTVKFSRDAQAGYDVKRLNQAIIDYISPWHATGYQTTFGWTIRREDIESYVRGLEYVDFVTNFSMLHIVKDDAGRYNLADTARIEKATARPTQQQSGYFEQIRPRYPWSLAIPVMDHYIETMPIMRSIAAEPTGIEELEVGNTFIINAERNHG